MDNNQTQSDGLRRRTEQHKPKNIKSKFEDKAIYKASCEVMNYIKDRFEMDTKYPNYHLEFSKEIKIEDMIKFIKRKGIRKEFDERYNDNRILPDGGVIYLVKEDDSKNIERLPLVIAEVKHQGTNEDRIKEGKEKQATGNAIERLGKNLTGIKAMLHYEAITPFVCFGSGCDFDEKQITTLVKVSVLNEFYELNRIYVYKRDGDVNNGSFSPVSMFFKADEWTDKEMFNIIKEIAETSFRYYVF